MTVDKPEQAEARRTKLITALRCEKDCDDCAYHTDNAWSRCDEWGMRCDAADALEAAEKRIAELERNFSDVCNANGSLACERNELLNDVRKLEAQMPKEGEWIMCESEKPYIVCKCSVCGGMTSEFGYYCPNCGAKMKGANDGES